MRNRTLSARLYGHVYLPGSLDGFGDFWTAMAAAA